jgi:penicillin-binding protein 1C
MGNLDHEPTDGITGATGPALVLRSIFSELNKNSSSRKLYLSPKLEQKNICIDYDKGEPCVMRTEYFMQGREPEEKEKTSTTEAFEIARPSDGMQMAYDPRVPADHQAFEFALSGVADDAKVIWIINGSREAETTGNKYLWPLNRGKFKLSAKVWDNGKWQETKPISFVVK